jgi:hypothetical protein
MASFEVPGEYHDMSPNEVEALKRHPFRDAEYELAKKRQDLGIPVRQRLSQIEPRQTEAAPGEHHLPDTLKVMEQHPQGANLAAMEEREVANAVRARAVGEQIQKSQEAMQEKAMQFGERAAARVGSAEDAAKALRAPAMAAPFALAGLAAGHHLLSEKYKGSTGEKVFNQGLTPALAGTAMGISAGGVLGALKGKPLGRSALLGAGLGAVGGVGLDQAMRAMNTGAMLDKSPRQIREHIEKQRLVPAMNAGTNALSGGVVAGTSALALHSMGVAPKWTVPAAAVGGAALAGSLGYHYGRTALDQLKERAQLFGVDPEMKTASLFVDNGALRRGVFPAIGEEAARVMQSKAPTSSLPDKFRRFGNYLEQNVHLPEEIADAAPEKLTRVQRAKQVLLGYRPAALREQYESVAPGPEKEKLLKALTREDSNTGMARAGLGSVAAPLAAGSMYAGYRGAKKFIPSVDMKYTGEKGNASEEEIARRKELVGASGTLTADVADRLNTDKGSTSKVTLQDATDVAKGTGGAAALTRYTGNSSLSRLLGVETGYHGTTPEAAQKILATGLDPAFGAREGGATRRLVAQSNVAAALRGEKPMTREDIHRLNPAQAAHVLDAHLGYGGEHLADEIEPKMPLMTQSHVPINTEQFVDNARNRTYIARGEPGMYAAAQYASMQDPLVARRMKAEGGAHLADAAERRDIGGMGKGLSEVASAPMRARAEMMSDVPGKGRVVAMAMPMEKFEKNFEFDGDDATRFQHGFRTVRDEQGKGVPLIGKEHLNLGEVTTGNIVRNRSKDMMGYIKKHPGRFAAGVAGTGLNVAAHGYNLAHNIIPTVGKMIPDAVKDKVRSMMPTIASPETASAPEQ